ncbi:MAG: hypothetical protein JWP05_1567 [Microbacteriaceae bacterium]|nr:hypothetical protein [Microbacteriaceae bacterium]
MAYGRAMRQLARVCLVGIVACGALGLGGCVPSGPDRTPNAVTTSKPVFESDAAALAAATKAYAAYLAMSDTISQEGGANPERLASLVTPEWLAHEVTSAEALAKSGNHQDGVTSFDNSRLQSREPGSDGAQNVAIYACLDLTGARLLSQGNHDMTAPGGNGRFPVVVTFKALQGNVGRMLLDKNSPWDGNDFC